MLFRISTLYTKEPELSVVFIMTEWKNIREIIIKRDQLKCRLCGKSPSAQVHHIIPKSKGETNNYDNLVTLCGKCHMLLSPVPNHIISKVWKISLDEVNVERIKTQELMHRLTDRH